MKHSKWLAMYITLSDAGFSERDIAEFSYLDIDTLRDNKKEAIDDFINNNCIREKGKRYEKAPRKDL